jgi:hypothetical protein
MQAWTATTAPLGMDDTDFDSEILEYLHAYRGATIPIANIAKAVTPNGDHGGWSA